MRIHLINPSEVSFGTAVITPRWLYVLAAATPASFGDPCLVDETLEAVDQWTFTLEILSVSASTRPMHFAVTRLGEWLAIVVRTWCSEAFTRPFIPAKRWSLVLPMLLSKATERWCGGKYCRIVAAALSSRSTTEAGLRPRNSCLHAGVG